MKRSARSSVVEVFVGFVWLVCCPTVTAAIEIVTVPPDLNPGDQYRLVYVTNATLPATNSNASFYNSFVQAHITNLGEGNALYDLNTEWKALVSTTSGDVARVNTGTDPTAEAGVPVYNLAGQRIADNNADLWDGAIANPVMYTETGGTGAVVWTGSTWTGVAGTWPLGGNTWEQAQNADATSQASNWIRGSSSQAQYSNQIYGMSGVLTVPGGVSAPALSIWGIGTLVLSLAALACWRLRRPVLLRATG